MTKAELAQEVIDRGYDYIASARIKASVERNYQRICARHSWPFLHETTTGTAPVTFTDLRKILSVKDTTTETTLRGTDRRILESMYPDLTETGTPSFWYLEGEVLNVYPVAEDSLSVRYVKVPAELEENDEPLIPEEFQYLIADWSVVDCLRDDDEYAEARALLADVKEAIDTEMVPALLNRNSQNGELLVRTGWDYL